MRTKNCSICGLAIDASLHPERVQIHGYEQVLDRCPNILEDRAEHPDWELDTHHCVPLMRELGEEYQGQP